MNTKDPFAGERLKLSHFHPRQAALNLRNAWTSWNGYQFAEYYYDTEFEYFCVRNTCGTYDICPMQKYFISGTDAEAMLDRMVTRDVTKLKENRVTYVCWCTDEGRIVDDGTIFKLGPSMFMLACGSPNLAWLKKSAFGYRDVTIADMSDDIAALSFQGPTTCEVLKKMGLNGIDTLKPFGIMHFPFGGGDEDTLMVSRTGYTGDLEYDLSESKPVGSSCLVIARRAKSEARRTTSDLSRPSFSGDGSPSRYTIQHFRLIRLEKAIPYLFLFLSKW